VAEKIIVFDGLCGLCNGAIHFIIANERASVFYFAPLQGEKARSLAREHNLEIDEAETIYLLANGRVYRRSDAVLEIARDLVQPWRALAWFRFAPRWLRDTVYRVIARHRHRLFRRRKALQVPDEKVKERYLM